MQNLTNVPMSLSSVNLEPSTHFNCKSLNKIKSNSSSAEDAGHDKDQLMAVTDGGDGHEGQEWVFGPINRFQPNEFRQYLFCLSPKDEIKNNFKLLKTVTIIGKLDIVWMSGIGCNGHLQTSQLERMAPNYKEIKLTIEKIPSQVALKQVFDISVKLTNCSDTEMEPFLSFDNQDKDVSILWLGISGKSLGKVKPGSAIDFDMKCYPVQTGLSPIPKLRISVPGNNLKLEETFSELSYVFVNEQNVNEQ